MRNDGLNVYKTTESVVPIVFKEIFDKPITKTIVLADLKSDTTKIDAGAVFGISSGMAKLMKTAKVYEAVAAGGTDVKVCNSSPDHQFKADDFVIYGDVSTKISSITEGDDYDTLTLTATLDSKEAVPKDSVLYLGSAETTNAATAGTAVVEDAEGNTLTVSNTDGLNNGVTVTISQNGSDALAVSYTVATNTLAIALASSTATKNTAALIQTAVRALGYANGIDFTNWTFAAGGDWDTAATGGTLTIPTDYISGGSPKPSYMAPAYTDLVLMHQKVEFDLDEDANVSGGMIRRCVVDESNMPYPIPTAYKTLLTDRVRFE